MEKIESSWKVASNGLIFLFGIPFSLIGFIFLIMNKGPGFIINGLLWITVGVFIKIKVKFDQHRLLAYKKTGVCCDAKISSILPNSFIRIGTYIVSRVQCTYGEHCIKSNYVLLTPFDKKENLCAKIYFSDKSLHKFVVELYRISL